MSGFAGGGSPLLQLVAGSHARSASMSLSSSPAAAAATAAAAALACPICGVAAPSVYQLNVHLDEAHALGDAATGSGSYDDGSISGSNAGGSSAGTDLRNAVTSFFRTAQRKVIDPLARLGNSPSNEGDVDARRTTPPAVPPRPLSTSVSTSAAAANGNGHSSGHSSGHGSGYGHARSSSFSFNAASERTSPAPRLTRTSTPEGGITRAHWQPAGPNAVCSHPGCGRALSSSTSASASASSLYDSAGLALGRPHNCHRCGRLMCEQHCSQRLRLAPNASHDAARGQWAPVCTQCFGAAQPHLARQQATAQQPGQTRSRTAELARLKAAASTQLLLETNRLEKRLEKLASALQVPTVDMAHIGSDGHAASQSTASTAQQQNKQNQQLQLQQQHQLQQHRPQRTFFVANQRQLEQSVVAWEPDSVASCRVCSSAFGVFTSRRHHCRLCGMCVCGRAECSTSYLVSNGAFPIDDSAHAPSPLAPFMMSSPQLSLHSQSPLSSLHSPMRSSPLRHARSSSTAAAAGTRRTGDYAYRPLVFPAPTSEQMLAASMLSKTRLSAADVPDVPDVPVFTPTPRNTGVMVRFCSTCIGTLCRRQEKLMALLSPPRYVTLYQQLLGARADIERMLPRFTELVGSVSQLASSSAAGSSAAGSSSAAVSLDRHPEFGRAMAMRRQLQDAFAQYDATAKAIARLPVASASSSSARMYSNIYNAAVMYMQARMVPLNVLPRMLHESTQQQKAQRQQSSDGGDAVKVLSFGQLMGSDSPGSGSAEPAGGGSGGADSPLSHQQQHHQQQQQSAVSTDSHPTLFASMSSISASILGVFGQSASSDAASAEKRGAARQQLTEAERLEAMQMVQVLREQRTQVAGFVAEAVKHRRLEDAQTLQLSLDELDGEISRIAASLS